MQMEETTFFGKLIDSIKSIEKYPEMATKSLKSVIAYMIILLLLFCSILSIVQTCSITNQIKKGTEYLKTRLP